MHDHTFEDIVNFFDNHIKISGKRYYSDFYVGITNNVNQRLFTEHNVNRDTMWWVYSTAISKEVAEQVEKYYLDKGMRGSFGGGTPEPDYKIVYSYAVSPTTVDRGYKNA